MYVTKVRPWKSRSWQAPEGEQLYSADGLARKEHITGGDPDQHLETLEESQDQTVR